MSAVSAVQFGSRWNEEELQPELIAFEQTERRLDDEGFVLIVVVVWIRPSCAHFDPVLVEEDVRLVPFGRFLQVHGPAGGEKVLARHGRREFARLQVHGPSDVELFDVEWNGRVGLIEIVGHSLNVEIGWAWFDVGVSDKSLRSCEINQFT